MNSLVSKKSENSILNSLKKSETRFSQCLRNVSMNQTWVIFRVNCTSLNNILKRFLAEHRANSVSNNRTKIGNVNAKMRSMMPALQTSTQLKSPGTSWNATNLIQQRGHHVSSIFLLGFLCFILRYLVAFASLYRWIISGIGVFATSDSVFCSMSTVDTAETLTLQRSAHRQV